MINIIAFPQDTNFLYPLSLIGIGVFIHEAITYPLDRILNRTIALQQSGQFRGIYQKESFSGLFKGFRTGLDRSLAKHISSYFIFQYYFNNYGIKFYSKPERQDDSQPGLRYCEGSRFIGFGILSSIVSTIITQPNTIVKLKIQCEQLGIGKQQGNLQHADEIINYHSQKKSILFSPGLKSRCFLNSAIFFTEMTILQLLLEQNGYIFTNKNTDKSEQQYNPLVLAGITSIITATIIQPLQYLQKRYTMRTLQNLQTLSLINMLRNDGEALKGLSRGYFLNLIRTSSRNLLAFGILWQTAK